MARQAGRLIAAGLVIATVVAVPSQTATTGSSLKAELHAHGPRALMDRHFQDAPGLSGDGYAVVEAGTPDAIAVAVELLDTVADGAVSERLHSALGTALQRHPELVLPLVGTSDNLSAESICLPWMFEASSSHVRSELAKTRAALDRPVARRFLKQRAACLAQLAKAERAIK